jgi:hypothetical protein
MKRFRFITAMLVSALAIGLAFVGCKADSEPTYTVWAGTMTNSEFSATFGLALQDNSYASLEFTNTEWEQYRALMPASYKHDWTENQIYTWFLESSFSQTTSRQLSVWLTVINHGSVALRRGSLVYAIAK